MITIQSLKVILKIRNANEPCLTFIEDNLCYIYKQSDLGVYNSVKDSSTPVCVVPINILDFLKRNNYIKDYSTEVILNHEAFTVGQIFTLTFLKFLTKSVIVPIIVALITSYIYNRYK